MKATEMVKVLQKNIELFGDSDVYLLCSVGGTGIHVGRIKDITMDANNNSVVYGDIDKLSAIR